MYGKFSDEQIRDAVKNIIENNLSLEMQANIMKIDPTNLRKSIKRVDKNLYKELCVFLKQHRIVANRKPRATLYDNVAKLKDLGPEGIELEKQVRALFSYNKKTTNRVLIPPTATNYA